MDTGETTGQFGQMRLTRTGILLWSSERRGVGHFDSSRVESSQVEAMCVGKVWSMCSALLCSRSLAFLLGADDKRDDMGHGGNLLWVERTSRSGNADGQRTAERKTGTSRQQEWTAALTRRGPTVSIPTGPGLLKSSLASLEV